MMGLGISLFKISHATVVCVDVAAGVRYVKRAFASRARFIAVQKTTRKKQNRQRSAYAVLL